MILFSKDKEIILKIVNAVFLLWFIIALLAIGNITINMLVMEKTQTYEEYKLISCGSLSIKNPSDPALNKGVSEADCKLMYDQYKYNNRNNTYYQKVDLYKGIANAVIVLGTLFILNRKKEIVKIK